LRDPAREHERERSVPKGPSSREQLKATHVAGRSVRFGREEILAVMRRLVDGDARTRLGLPPFLDLTMTQVEAAMESVYGWKGDGPRARIAPARTIEGFVSARDRVLEVARVGGTLAFATSRPASLLAVYRALATAAVDAGGSVLTQTESALVGPGGRRLWWLDGVAMLTDHESLFGDAGTDAAEELLFTLPRPDLVIADRVFAGTAAAAGLEVVAFVDLDAAALAVAAWRGLAVRVVPLDERRPPASYEPLVALVAEADVTPEPDAETETVA
jgi:hypothetical protein